MNNTNYIGGLLLMLITFTASSCEIAEGIFKAGMGFGIFIVLAIIALIIFIIVRIGGGRNKKG